MRGESIARRISHTRNGGQTMVEAIIVVAVVAAAMLGIFPYLRGAIAWMWKSGADQTSGYVPYQP